MDALMINHASLGVRVRTRTSVRAPLKSCLAGDDVTTSVGYVRATAKVTTVD